jgi:hypothetical protein
LTILARLIQPLERQIIMTLLWLEMPIEESVISSWMTREGKVYVRLSFIHHMVFNKLIVPQAIPRSTEISLHPWDSSKLERGAHG